MKKLLTDVLARLGTMAPAFLKYIDEDWGQLDYYGAHPPVKFPAAVVDCINATYSNTGQGGQLADVQIIVRVADMKLTNSSGMAPPTQKDQAFAIYDVLVAVTDALHTWPGNENYSRLIRQSMRKAKRSDGMRVHEITFTCRLNEPAALSLQAAAPEPAMTVKFNTG